MTYTQKYTFNGDPVIEKKVNEVIERLTDEIVIHLRPKSIILIGSFGRGEAMVNLNGRELKFISDCDIIVISNKYISRKTMEKVSFEIAQKTGLETGISGIELSIYFMLSRIFPKIWEPSIDNYEMKYGSRVVYGEDCLQKIPDFKPEDIPLWEGIRLILNRMIESLKSFSTGYLSTSASKEKERNLIFWINKIILACQDALLISIKKYHHSYKIRNDIFQEVFPAYFRELSRELPQFFSLTLQATKCRLNPDEPYSGNILDLWFRTAEICDKVFRYIIEMDTGITFDTYLEFQEKYLVHPHIRRKYYRGLTPFPVYQNLRSMAKMLYCSGRLPRFKSLVRAGTPWTHIIYSTIPLIYFSVSKDGKIDEALLVKAKQRLSLLRKLKPINMGVSREWEYVKKQILDLWQGMCY